MHLDETQANDERPPVARTGPRRKAAVGIAAAALVAGDTVRDAAAKAGIGRRTLTRWLANPKFVARVEALRTEAVTTAMNRLNTSMSAAADTLTELLTDDDAQMRFKAAKAVLEITMRLKEHGELTQRIMDLERARANPPQMPRPTQRVEDVL